MEYFKTCTSTYSPLKRWQIVKGFPPVWVTNEKYAGGEETTSKDILPHGRGTLTTNAMQCSVPLFVLVSFDICGFYGKSKPDSSLHKWRFRQTSLSIPTGVCLRRTYYEDEFVGVTSKVLRCSLGCRVSSPPTFSRVSDTLSLYFEALHWPLYTKIRKRSNNRRAE
jgi:hypothetical protein